MEAQNLEDEAASLFLGPLRHFRHGTPVRCKCVSDKTNASIPGSPMSGGLPNLLRRRHRLIAVAINTTMCSYSPRKGNQVAKCLLACLQQHRALQQHAIHARIAQYVSKVASLAEIVFALRHSHRLSPSLAFPFRIPTSSPLRNRPALSI